MYIQKIFVVSPMGSLLTNRQKQPTECQFIWLGHKD